jgi:hypothetical protein
MNQGFVLTLVSVWWPLLVPWPSTESYQRSCSHSRVQAAMKPALVLMVLIAQFRGHSYPNVT